MAVAVIENGMLYVVYCTTNYVNNPPKLKTMLTLLLVASTCICSFFFHYCIHVVTTHFKCHLTIT